jgi:hypothetical protein
MNLIHHLPIRTLRLILLLLAALVLLVACAAGDETTGNDNPAGANETDHEDGDDHEHVDGEEQTAAEDRVPNNGAVIRILAPADGAVFAAGEEIIVEVEVEDFELGVEGSHWHVYVDGASWGMVMGGNTDQALRGLEAGAHRIEVYLAGGDHLDLEDGDAITITVE